ncbi:hypothetical protein [Butyricimonas paravirosa]|uniref:hypothetical protein n=1 Tax=Butyricimonas paravirosa TaxID=1472417 RepID=UPI003977D122
MKPVEIEFIMRDKLSDGVDKATKSTGSLGDRAEQVSKNITDRIAEQKEQIKYVESCLKDLKKQYDNLAPGKAQMEMRAEIEACTKALQEDKNILASLEAEHSKTAASSKRLSTQLEGLLDTMARLRLEGKQNTKEYQDMAAKAATLSDAIGDLRTQTNILANDNAGLQGVISGANGLSGVFTMATGLMGAFASENEDLIKIQTRVQSVMAITMGLQQVMNTLNKDSAFRLVTVVKMKKLLTAANTKLAVSLGISNAAATALMATLTLGLSAVITGLIVLWDKYGDAQEQAAEKAKERVKIESDGRAQMIKTRFEIENTTKSLKDFTGSKEQEKAKVEELNRKYGESFGYYNTVAEWYDVLIQKSDDYIQMLFLQAKAQSLVNKAVEADEKVNEVKATPESDVEGSMGWFSKMGLYMAQGESYGQIDAQALIEKYNKEAKDAAVRAAEEQRDTYLEEARKLQEEYAELGKKSGIGGFVAPENNKDKAKPANNLAELELKARQKIEDQRIAILKEGYDKEREEASLNFEREKERINREEQQRIELYNKLKAAGEKVTPEQLANISAQAATQRIQAAQIYDATVAEIDGREKKDTEEKRKKQQETLQELLTKYRDYEAQRAAIKKQGDDDIAKLEAERTEANSAEIDRAIAVAREKVRQGIQSVNDAEADSISRDNDFFKKLFGDYSSMSFDSLQKLISQAKQLRTYLSGKGDAKGITFISPDQLKNIEKSPAELEKLKKALDKLLDTGKGGNNKWENIFKTFEKGFAELKGAKGAKEVSGAIGTISGAASEAAGELANMFDQMGDTEVADALNGMQQVMGAVSNIGQGFAKGGLIGGIGAAIGEAANFLTSAFAAEARHKEALKEIEKARLDFQRQYNLLLLEQNLLLEKAENIFGERQVAKAVGAIEVYRDALSQFKDELAGDAPTMNWIERMTGDVAGTYRKRLENYQKGFGGLNDAQIVTGHKKTGLFGWGKGKDVYSGILDVYPELIKANGELDTEMLQVILDTRKMSDETRNYLENLIALKDAMDEAEQALDDYLQETFGSLGQGMLDSITSAIKGSGTALGNFADQAASVLENLGEQIAYSLFFADKFDDLQKRLKEVYGSGKSEEQIAGDAMRLIDNFYDNIGNNVDAAQSWMEAWKDKAAAMGYDLWKNDEEKTTTQSGRSGAFQTLTQEQGTKLEGLMTSLQMHDASIDENVENISEGIGGALEMIDKIKTNTDALPKIYDEIRDIKQNGLKMK